MSNACCFETLTNRYVEILEMIEILNLDLQSLIKLLDANVEAEEKHSNIPDPCNSNYPAKARRHRIRRDKLIAAISRSQERTMLH
jgi:hypothetical protein